MFDTTAAVREYFMTAVVAAVQLSAYTVSVVQQGLMVLVETDC
jgi:hypothetical protein